MFARSAVAAATVALAAALVPAACSPTGPTTVGIYVTRTPDTPAIFSLKGTVLMVPGVERNAVTLNPIEIKGLPDAGPEPQALPFPLELSFDVDSSLAGDRLFAIGGFDKDGTTQVAAAGSSVNVVAHGNAISNPADLVPGTCGDGIVDRDEECDDGNSLPSRRCSPTCLLQSDGDAGRD